MWLCDEVATSPGCHYTFTSERWERLKQPPRYHECRSKCVLKMDGRTDGQSKSAIFFFKNVNVLSEARAAQSEVSIDKVSQYRKH